MNDSRNVHLALTRTATIRSNCALSTTNGRAPYRRFRAAQRRLGHITQHVQIIRFCMREGQAFPTTACACIHTRLRIAALLAQGQTAGSISQHLFVL